MKPSFNLKCPHCGSICFEVRHEANSPDYRLVCGTCIMPIATIPTYSVQFADAEQEEPNANQAP